MKTEYDKNSWHYKFLKKVHGEFYSMPDNTCDYWSTIITTSGVLLLLGILLTIGVSGIAFIAYTICYYAFATITDNVLMMQYYAYDIGKRFFQAIVILSTLFAIIYVICKTFIWVANFPKSNYAFNDFVESIKKKSCKQIIFVDKKK